MKKTLKGCALPLAALTVLNLGEYGELALWGVVEPWHDAWQPGTERIDSNALLLCVASIVVLATTVMGFAIAYSSLRAEFEPREALLRVLCAGALALPCLLLCLGLTLTLTPEWFFMTLFPLVPLALALPFLAILRLSMPSSERQNAMASDENATATESALFRSR